MTAKSHREMPSGDEDTKTTDDEKIKEGVENRIAELNATVFRSMEERREASIEAGRAFNELKYILGHGKWERHFEEIFASQMSLRTAERWMERARKADADAKNDNVSLAIEATDQDAQEISRATEDDEDEVYAVLRRSEPKKKNRLYTLPLRMTDAEKDALQALRKSGKWPRAEKKIIQLLKRLCVKYGVINEGDLGGSDENASTQA